MDIPIQPRKLTRLLTAVALLLVCASVAGTVARYGFGHGGLMGFTRMFNLMEEANVPTWFSSTLLFVCAGWLWLIGRRAKSEGGRYARHWTGLALVFLLLSLDETAQLHDLVGDRLHERFHTTGIFYYAWVIPACVFLALLAIAYARFLIHLPRRTCLLFLVAGAVYVGGALGMEMVAAVHDQANGYDNVITASMATVEETMEMLGLVLFNYALTTYLALASGDEGLRFRPSAPPAVAA